MCDVVWLCSLIAFRMSSFMLGCYLIFAVVVFVAVCCLCSFVMFLFACSSVVIDVCWLLCYCFVVVLLIS